MKTQLFKHLVPGTEGQGEIVTKRGMLGVLLGGGEWQPLAIAGGAYGTLSVLDALSNSLTSVIALGEQTVYDQLKVALAAHNDMVNDLMGNLVETTTDVRRSYGGNDEMTLDELDEYARPDSQKITAGALLDFPLRKYGISVQWTRDSLEVMTGQQLAAQFIAAQDGDMRTFQREIKRAFFRVANYTAVDRHVNATTTLNIKRLVNADSAVIPLGPNGEAFVGSSHTHYLFTAAASLAAADVNTLIERVIEHHATGTARIWINRAQETAMRGLAGFTAYLDARIVNQTAGIVARNSLDSFDLNNREIGVYSAGGVSAVVTVKPWIPSGYLFCWVDGGPTPLVRRIRNAARGQFRLVAEDEHYPLRARTLEREHGFAVWNRTNGAALFVDASSGGAYVNPTLN